MRDVDVVTRFVQAINVRDADRIAALASLDHEFIDSRGGSVCGREAVRVAWQGYFAFCSDYWVRPDEVISCGACVVVFGEAGGIIIETGQLLAANAWRIPAAWRAVVKGDLVERWQVYADNGPVYDILARLPSGAAGAT